MSDYISGKEFIESRNLKGFEFFQNYIKRGLQPHDSDTGEIVPPPDVSSTLDALEAKHREHKQLTDEKGLDLRNLSNDPQNWDRELELMEGDYYFHPHSQLLIEVAALRKCWELEKEIANLQWDLPEPANRYSWRDYNLPNSKTEARRVIDRLLGCVYSWKEIEEIDKKDAQEEEEFDKAFPNAVEYNEIENMGPQNITEVVEKRMLLAELGKELEPSYNYFKGSEDAVKAQEQYMFRKEGPTWSIVYEGKTLRGLRGKGFEIICYLVCNQGKDFRTNDLAKEFDKTIVAEEKKFVDTPSSENDHRFNGKLIQDVGDIIDNKTKTDIQDHRNYLHKELREAQENNDIPRIEKIEQEIKDLDKYLIKSLKRSGKSQQFINETMKVKNRICKRIERALQSLKKDDENTYLHFKRALSPINSFFQSYRPDRHVDWHT